METRNFINGKFIDSISKQKIRVLNPSNQQTVGFIDEGLDDEIDLAFSAASKAFRNRLLQDMDASIKSNMMRSIASKIREYKKVGSKILSQENLENEFTNIWRAPKIDFDKNHYIIQNQE